jgi:hypothetical protein
MELARCHLELLASEGLLVSEQFPARGVCPNGYRVFKPCADGRDVCRRSWGVGTGTGLLPRGVRQLSGVDGEKLRQILGPTVATYAVEGPGLWIRGEAGRWLVYDGDVRYPGGVIPSFRWEFDSADEAVVALLGFFACGGT